MSIKRILVVLAAFTVVGLPMASAQAQPEVGPGMIGADSPVYGLEVAWDNAAVSVGLKRAGQVAQERAAEAKYAAERDKPEAAARAAQDTQKVAGKARTQEDEEGIQRAMNSLKETMSQMEQRMQDAPNEQARQGMQNALENMQGALNNMGEAKQRREEARRKGEDAREDEPRERPENSGSQIEQNQSDAPAEIPGQ